MGATRRPTHCPLIKELAEFVLEYPKHAVLDYEVKTNLVKCSTIIKDKPNPSFFSSLGSEDKLTIGRECHKRHLQQEVNYWNPQNIIVCGGDADKILKKIEFGSPYHTCYHPSASRPGQRKTRKQQLIEIGKKIRNSD